MTLVASRCHRRHTSLRSALFLALTAMSLGASAQQGFDQPAQMNPPPMPQHGQPAGQMQMQPPPMPSQHNGGYAGQPAMPVSQQPPAGWQPPPGQPGHVGPNSGPNGFNQQPPTPEMQQAMHGVQRVVQQEMQDFGVPPQAQLQSTMHGPTPTSIPGGQVITTDRLLGLYSQAQQNGLLVFHVLGPGPTLPNAQNAAPASQPGSFNDQTQQEFGNYLRQVTQGNNARPLVFYCQSTQCWMSYNAALRAINMGFSQVYWYRGGIEAWQQVQQMASALPQQGAMQPPSGYQNAGYQQQPDQRGW